MELSFNPFLDAVVAAIKAYLPALSSCERHDGRFDAEEIKKFAVKTPAVRAAILGLSSIESLASGERDVELMCAAYVSTANTAGLPREVAAINIVEALTLFIDDNGFGCGHPATDVKAQNLYSESAGQGKSGCHIWAISWSQIVRTGEDMFGPDPTFVVPSELYIGFDPDTGPPHVDDYVWVDVRSDV